MKNYVVINVGCIECGEDTFLIHVGTDRAVAVAAMAEFAEGVGRASADGEPFSYFGDGQNYVELHEWPAASKEETREGE